MGDSQCTLMRVLVVEDNLSDQELLRRELRKTDIGQNVVFLSDPAWL